MIYLDVDTAITVPVNTVALTDDTDFKSREIAIAYDQAGMDLVWNFITSAGVITQTAVTPTTGGDYDWSHVGDGMYKIEIPASGGGSINNDTEGYGYFTGICTGVLAWRGPTIGFRAAGLNDLLCDSAYSATRGLTGTALPGAAADAAGGLPISDDGGLDMDILAEIETHVHNLAYGTAGINTTPKDAPDGFTITTGTSEANDEDSTHALDGTTHDIEDDSPNTDVYYEFNVGTEGVPFEISWHGFANAQGDSFAVYGYDFGNTAWVQVGTINCVASTAVTLESFALTTNLVESGVGTVRVRFYSTDATKLGTDQILVSYTAVLSSAGIVNEWETQSQAAPTGFHVNVVMNNSVAQEMYNAYPLVCAYALGASGSARVQRAIDLALISQYLISNSLTINDDSVVKDGSIVAQALATSGDISGYVPATDALQSIRDAMAVPGSKMDLLDTIMEDS